MRFVLFTYPDPDYAARYDQLSPEEQQAEVAHHMAWFERHRERIRGGEELGWPRETRVVRRRAGQPVVTDGPFAESKEVLGGFVVIDAADLDEAVRIAAEWPSLLQGEGARVDVVPTFDRDPGAS